MASTLAVINSDSDITMSSGDYIFLLGCVFLRRSICLTADGNMAVLCLICVTVTLCFSPTFFLSALIPQ